MLTLLTQWLFLSAHRAVIMIKSFVFYMKNSARELDDWPEEKDAHGVARTRCILTSLLYVHIGLPMVLVLELNTVADTQAKGQGNVRGS